MRTILKATMAIVIIIVSTGVASASPDQTKTIGELMAQREADKKAEAERLEEQEKKILESAQETAIRERAEEIKKEKLRSEAKKKVASQDTPEQRQARKELEDANKAMSKLTEKTVKTFRRARISGCNESGMKIHPDAVEHSTINSFVKIRVTNLSKVSVDISDAKFGTIVEGLCSGGSMTIFRNRSLHSPDYMQFSYTATARHPDGTVRVTQSETYSLSKYDWRSGGGQQERFWFIQER